MMTTDYDDPNFDWAAYGAAREVKRERELLRDARNGDELAAQELLLWPKLYRREMIDPEVYDAIVDGALAVAAYVADKTRSPKPNKHIDLSITPLMFFNGAQHEDRKDGNKPLSAKERYIELVVARDDTSDDTRLSEDELRIALTSSFEKAVPDNLPDNRRPKTYREAEARLVVYVQHKYQRKDRADLHFQRKVMDPEICKLLIGWSYPQHFWHRDAKEPFPYPPEWDSRSGT
jgi:hypothetical protein